MVIFSDNLIAFDQINLKFGNGKCSCEIYDDEVYDQELIQKTVNDFTVLQLKEKKQEK